MDIFSEANCFLLQLYMAEEQNRFDIFELLNRNNIVMLLWFLAIYFVITQLIGLSFGQDKKHDISSKVLDGVTLCVIIVAMIQYFTSNNLDDAVNDTGKNASSLATYIDGDYSIFNIAIVICLLYFFIYLTGVPMSSDQKPVTIKIIENGSWLLFAVILINWITKQAFGVNLIEHLRDYKYQHKPLL
jgi:hypothetical protein